MRELVETICRATRATKLSPRSVATRAQASIEEASRGEAAEGSRTSRLFFSALVEMKGSPKPKSPCARRHEKKYVERPSPAFPANSCPGQKKRGNDGRLYASTPDRRGVHRWRAVSPRPRK